MPVEVRAQALRTVQKVVTSRKGSAKRSKKSLSPEEAAARKARQKVITLTLVIILVVGGGIGGLFAVLYEAPRTVSVELKRYL